jgi:hypothetical protein
METVLTLVVMAALLISFVVILIKKLDMAWAAVSVCTAFGLLTMAYGYLPDGILILAAVDVYVCIRLLKETHASKA